ncbi:MAG: winged helix-turn-helix transcriptional regulator [Chloroflexales bacterium]|nr:winged helix-turn-helix transcriptional regulator [Chloroflexales bacterium]
MVTPRGDEQAHQLEKDPRPDNVAAATAEALLDAAGQALFQLGRVFSRHPLHRVLHEHSERPVQLSQILITQAVASVQVESGQDTTVGAVAERLAIDPSTASRLVAETIGAGYLSRTASATDGRRSHLVLTDAGHALVAHARRYQRSVFEQVTQTWPEQEQLAFARLFIQFAHAVIERYPAVKDDAS